MPTYGGMNPGFERYGGGTPALRRIVESLGEARGTAYDSTQDSNVYPENFAVARALAECWSNNQRMANQWDAQRMTEFIPRWEAILGLYPAAGETDDQRRARIQTHLLRFSETGVYQTVYDTLLAILGSDVFVGIVHTTSDATPSGSPLEANGPAQVWTPSDWSVGQHDATGAVNFYSNIAHILIEVTQPRGMTDGEFYDLVAKINPVLDNLLPAWVTWDWFRRAHNGQKGFYLDGDPVVTGTLVNLDNEAFDR